MWLFCTITTKVWLNKFWNETYAKKDLSVKSKGFWENISEHIYGFVLILCYVVQITLITFLLRVLFSGLIGLIASKIYNIVCISLLFSWTVFEPKLIKEGQDLFQRIYYFEKRWLYFLGYGLPLSVVYTNLPWKLGIGIWFLGLMFLSVRAILVKPQKFKHEKRKSPHKPHKPHKPHFEERLRIFWLAEKITSKMLDIGFNF